MPIQPGQDSNHHAVYFVYPRESILYHFERKPEDPRIQHELNLEVDQFVNVLKGLRASYRRQPGKSSLTWI
jgi:Insecticide toxin TcdB middle/C-terminal region